MRFLFVDHRLGRRTVIILVLLILLVGGRLVYRAQHPPLSAQEIVGKGLDNLDAAYSYKYNLMAVSYIDGNETVLTEIEGIYNAPDRFYIKGETLANPLEAYIIGNEYIVRDPQDAWISFKGGQGPSLLRETVLFSESPLADLRRLHSVELVEERDFAGQRCYLLEGKLAGVSNPLWQVFWQDFTCRLWIDKREIRLRRLELHGTSIGSADSLQVSLEIFDYDAKLVISPPELAAQ